MMNSKNRNRGRMNSGGRTDKRIYPQDRPPRRSQYVDKNVNIDGVYKNQRFTHVVVSLVGSLVQVQVKNGIVYEGVLITYSEKGDIVLEVAHMVEDMSSAPNRDQILPKLIVKAKDLVMVNAVNVDLDYAVKDSFTDTGISKYNGEMDKEMRDLQPWDPEGGDEITLEGDGDKSSSNGWDANEMFQTNALQFNVKSSYDDSLEQYTTKLERRDSAEYRRREEEAQKLAAEIERNPNYMKHVAQENGDGDDEEAAFSSVVRPGDNSQMPQHMGAGGPQKYIPPNKRVGVSGGVQKPSTRGGYNSQQANVIRGAPPAHAPPHQPPTLVSSQLSSESVNGEDVGRPSIPASTAGPTVKTSPASHDHGPPTPDKHDHPGFKVDGRKQKGRVEQIAELKMFSSQFKLDDNKDPSKDREKDKDPRAPNNKDSVNNKLESTDNVSVINEERDSTSSTIECKGVSAAVSETERSETLSTVSSMSSQSMEQSSVCDDKLDLGSSGGGGAMKGMPSGMPPGHGGSMGLLGAGPPDMNAGMDPSAGATHSQQENKPDIISKSTLNPNAKEFVFAPKPPQHSQQSPTPPRPTTQSPIVQQAPVMNMPPQPVYPGQGQQFIMPPAAPAVVINTPGPAQPQMPAYSVRPKRAVVSVKPDTVQAQVQAATGQPLLAQSAQVPSYMYMMSGPPQPTGYQVGQVMQMPAVQPGQRGFMPPSSSVQGMNPSSMQQQQQQQQQAGGGNMEQQNNQSHQSGQAYMSQQGPMPAHMAHSSQFSHPNHHITHVISNSQPQPNQMNPSLPSGGVTGHHPAPSPVHTNPNQQSMNPGAHPPSSGTPQPPPGYPQGSIQGHPPLQPSPHNPTSPQNMQPMPYPYSGPGGHHPPMQMGGQGSGAGGGHQFSVQQQQQQSSGGANVPTSVTYSMQAHHTHSPHMQQIVMMPPHHPSASGQMNHSHIHSSHQFQPHPMAGGGAMQQQLMSQSGVQGLPGQNPGQGPHPPHQMQHFLPPAWCNKKIQHPGGQHIQQNYQASQ